ncbi:hypothetical protein P6P37_16630 [Clostridium perfringens]|nr:hypothetical protein [Clostridium perfringens]
MVITIILGLIIMNIFMYMSLFKVTKKADEELKLLFKKHNFQQ